MDVWDLYFATIAGWTLHPGYQREGSTNLTLDQAAAIADQMVKLREERQWQQPQQPSEPQQ